MSNDASRLARVCALAFVVAATAACDPQAVRDAIAIRDGGATQPTPDDIAKSVIQLNKAFADANVDPYEYAVNGMGVVRSNCHEFFDALSRTRRDALFSRREFAIAGGTAAAALGLAKASAKAIALTAAGFAAVDLTFDNFQSVVLFVPVAEQLRTLTLQTLLKYEDSDDTKNTLTALQNGPNDTAAKIRARDLVSNYAYLCTASAIEAYVQSALDSVEPQVTTTGSAASAPMATVTFTAK